MTFVCVLLTYNVRKLRVQVCKLSVMFRLSVGS